MCGACLAHPPAFDSCTTFADYVEPWKQLIAAFKFRQRIDLASALAHGLHQALDDSQASIPDRLPPFVQPFGLAPVRPFVLPIPLSDQRLRERGFNQAWELARRLAARRALPTSPFLLRRLRDTPHQIGMAREQRERNLRDAFWVDAHAGPALAGCHVALVDDVMTTGATAQAAALALRRAGVARVELWVLARTPLND